MPDWSWHGKLKGSHKPCWCEVSGLSVAAMCGQHKPPSLTQREICFPTEGKSGHTIKVLGQDDTILKVGESILSLYRSYLCWIYLICLPHLFSKELFNKFPVSFNPFPSIAQSDV